MKLTEIKTREEARQKAIDFQTWQSTQVLCYYDVILWSTYFENLANRFNLTGEFKENGII